MKTLIVVLVGAFVLAGCGSGGKDRDTAPVVDVNEPRPETIATNAPAK
jgi:PBP1b-binding outer membrane lipoprotein LpoB